MPTPTKQLHRRPAPPLDRVRAALGGMVRDLRTGGRDLYRDVETFVRSTHRDALKLGKALGTDVVELTRTPAAPAPKSRPKPRVSKPAARRAAKTRDRRLTPTLP